MQAPGRYSKSNTRTRFATNAARFASRPGEATLCSSGPCSIRKERDASRGKVADPAPSSSAAGYVWQNGTGIVAAKRSRRAACAVKLRGLSNARSKSVVRTQQRTDQTTSHRNDHDWPIMRYKRRGVADALLDVGIPRTHFAYLHLTSSIEGRLAKA